MKKEDFTFRQRWMPNLREAEDLREEGYSSVGRSMDFPVIDFFGRWARTLFLAGAVAWSAYQGIGNNIEYSKGQRVGVVNKVSEKGLIWKTKEGQLSLEGRTSTGDYVGAGVWDFSIDRLAKHGENVDELYSQIRQAMEEGQRVKITYKQPLAAWPWRASTTYLVQSVKPLEAKAK